VFIVLVTNWYCDYWIAKGAVIFALITAILCILMCYSKDKLVAE
jgi:hypothetical protein